MKNKIKTLLCNIGISDDQSIVPFYSSVRDRDDISVLRCYKSGVILLSRSNHMGISHYTSKEDYAYWEAGDRNTAIIAGYDDTKRRFEQFKNIIANKKWLDVGTGAGGILDSLSPIAAQTVAVEPQQGVRNELLKLGYQVYPHIDDVLTNNFEVATLFHVFEHMADPIDTLQKIRSKMSKDAVLIVEVPHAEDFLISFMNLDAFKSFTFWSEHLILHTRASLKLFLEEAGFTDVHIKGCQRYPLANHLYWLTQGKPGGHIKWDCLRTKELDRAYANMLSKLNHTDTLIAHAIS